MASYTTLKYGSKGDEVKKLQQGLINAGYDLGRSGADGVYGGRTQAAVRQYQQANGLSVDGVAGQQTLGKLYTPSTTTTTGDGTTPAQTAPKTTKEWADYYEDKSNEFKPPEITEREDYSSPYASDIESALDAWKNRKDFSYDFNTDPMYQQYRDQYILGGQQAMRDTMGQAAALTGGYGSSYGQMVGQQTYDNYLSQLNNIIPELRAQAYDQYAEEGNRLAEELSTYLSLDDTEYGRHRDTVNDRRLQDQEEYQRYMDELSYMQGERDYYYDKNADELSYELALLEAASGGGGRGSGKDNESKIKDKNDVLSEASKALASSGTAGAQKIIDDYHNAGLLTSVDAAFLYNWLSNQKLKGIGRGGSNVIITPGGGGVMRQETK